MKKHVLLIIALFALPVLTFYGQTNLPNGGMETWDTIVQGSYSFPQIGGPFFSTLNALGGIPPPIGPGPVTSIPTTDAHSGTYAAKLTSANFVLIPNDVFIPGMMGSVQLDLLASTAHLGTPCPGCKPTKFSGWYKFEQVNNDSCAAVLLVSKWNAAQHKKDTIGYCRTDFKVPVSTYTYFEMPVQYYSTTEEPDTMMLLCVSSGGFSVLNFEAGSGQPGNTMWVDDLDIEYPTGIHQVLMPEVGVKTYPNPASSVMTVEVSRLFPKTVLEIYTIDGQLLKSMTLSSLSTQVAVSHLPDGRYYYQVTDGQYLQNSGFFIVQK